ncbi:MAG: glutamate--tRNA ligase [Eubacteriales bacterium]|nr:glutamate--tRNA ligase [Eubacterium sp.]MDD7179938.1 glutamate--tRNA ligase [Eubacterium sp.]MDY5494227.1 glutamate--tRNA ligase [Eubacteriales bacterium]
MDYNYLAELLFPDVRETPEDMEKRYPPRELPEGAKVTRFAPSPTGFVHFGGLFPSTVGDRLAHQSGGVFYLRIEDTDAKREVPGAAEALIRTLETYGINFDEGAILGDDGKICDKGNYGPYKQSLRGPIYHVYAKQLVKEGKAYPCFSTEEELEELQQINKKEEIKNTDWEAVAAQRKAEMLARRNFTIEEVEANLKAGMPFVLRILADGDPEKKIKFTDLVKGNMEVTENDEDFVLLKSDGIPTYHFAHAVDDHLMGTTHVIRGEEWLPSLPKHIQLFRYLGFRLPKYMHIAQIMRLDENGNKKKLSKRDMGANMDEYTQMGYCPEAVCEYVMTLLNSNYEEWRMQNPTASYKEFPFSIKKMSVSGCLFDFDKLGDVSKNVVSKMTAEQVYEATAKWAKSFDPDFYSVFTRDPDFTKAVLAIGRGGNKPRKDFGRWDEVKGYMGFMFDELFNVEEEYPEKFPKEVIKSALEKFVATYDEGDDQNVWFGKIKDIAASIGFAADMKEYKANPEAFGGNVADVSMFLRLAVTGKMNSPDMYSVMKILGGDKVKARIGDMTERL